MRSRSSALIPSRCAETTVAALAVGALPCVPIVLAHLRVLNSGEVASYGLAAVANLSAQVGLVDHRVLLWRGLAGLIETLQIAGQAMIELEHQSASFSSDSALMQ